MQRLGLGIVVDKPAARNEVAKQIVVIIAFQICIDVALVLMAGVVAVFPLAPFVFFVEFLGDMPLSERRIQRVEDYPGTLRSKADLSTPFDSQPFAIILVGCCLIPGD